MRGSEELKIAESEIDRQVRSMILPHVDPD